MAHNFSDKNKASEAGKKSSRKGIPNKETKKLREFLSEFLDDNTEKFQEEMMKLTGTQFTNAFTALLEYSMPKLNRTDVTVEEVNKTRDPLKIEIIEPKKK